MYHGLRALLALGLFAALAAAAEPLALPAPVAESPYQTDDGPNVLAEPATTSAPQQAHLFGGTEYIFWWLREGRIPATLTTSPQASQGILGAPGTKLLYGDDRLETRHYDQFNGVRFNLGYWFGDACSFGLEGNAFFLERDSTYFKAVSDGSTLLARVYYLPNGTPASEVIAGQAPYGLRNGGFVGYSRVEFFGEEANMVANFYCDDALRLDGLLGARFLQMRDRTDLTATGYSLPYQETLFGLTDHYRTHNAYYGAQVGLRGSANYGPWFANLRGTIGLGGNDQQISAFGDSTYQTPFEKIVTPIGLTVQPSNTGTFSRAAVNMVSEVGLNIGCHLTSHIQVYGGYTFLLWDGLVRSGDQIDLVVNTAPGTQPARPTIPFKEDVFWAQGFNAGLEFSW